jgi:predicted DNA-binding WGR domain protein
MRLERVNPDRNEYRFYEITIQPTLFRDYALNVFWGRIGMPARHRVAQSGSFEEVEEAAEKLERSKMKRGYEPRTQSIF